MVIGERFKGGKKGEGLWWGWQGYGKEWEKWLRVGKGKD